MNLFKALRSSLQIELITTLAGAALFFSLVAGSADFIRTYKSELDRSHDTFDNLAATVSTSASIAVYVGNENIAVDVAEGLLKNQQILAVRIEGDNGFNFLRRKTGAPPEWDPVFELSYALYSPADNKDQVGYLRILTNATMITSRANEAALSQLLYLISQTLLLVLLLAVTYRRLVGQPLSKLTLQLANIEPGGDQRIAVDERHRNNEIGLVAASVNRYLEISEHALRMERELLDRVTRVETHYRRIFESTKVGVMVLDMNGGLINCNAVVTDRTGRGTPFDPTHYPLDFLNQIFKYPKRAWQLIEMARSSGQVATGDLELQSDTDEAHWAHCLFSIGTFAEEDQNYIEAVFYDVTSRRKREEKALRSAERDGLTDLVNRRGMEEYMQRSLADAEREGLGLTVFFMDLDGFKQANDTFGHAAGDTVLQEVSRRLRAVRRRSSDLLARIGGDEFLIAAYGMHKTDDAAHELANIILEAINEPIMLPGGQTATIGISIGIAGYPENALTAEALLEAADEAMYEAKKHGKNSYKVAPSKV